jgi:RNA polymerase sigma factor (sigma-70 family)
MGAPAPGLDRREGAVALDARPSPERVPAAPPGSFEDVYQSERAAVVRLAFLLVRSQAVAEELAQDAFLRLYERYAEVERPAGFLRTVVVRLCVTWQRRRQTEDRVLARIGVPRAEDPPEVAGGMWEALGHLRPERQAVLVLRFYEQMRNREIAAVLDCPMATVRSRTRRALQDLRKELDR